MTEESDLILNGINGAVNVTKFHYNNHNQIDGHQIVSSTKIETSVGTSLSIISSSTTSSTTTATTTTSIGANHVKHNSVTTNGGGRLQFFKDGKFILELATAREGDKKGWVSVPRKTYWPPTAPPNTNVNFHKNESSTSLSFSDDNSSIQSSPWQRDHCWKQTTPCRNKSKEMCMYYYRPIQYKLTNETKKYAKIKRRRPYDNKFYKFLIINDSSVDSGEKDNDKVIKIKKEDRNDDINDDIVSEKTKINDNDNIVDDIDVADVKLKHIEKEEDKDNIKIQCNNNINNNNNNINNCITNENNIVVVNTKDKKIVLNKKLLKNRQKLNIIIEKLIDKKPAGVKQLSNNKTLPVNINHHTSAISNHCINNNSLSIDTNNHQHVSPRKRILRELEKGSFEEALSIKKSRSKTITNNINICNTTPSIIGVQVQHTNFPYPNHATNGNVSSSISSNQLNDAVHPSTVSINNTSAPTTRTISSYSIKSLLGHNNNHNNISNNNSNNNISNNNHKSETYSSTSHLQSHREQILTDPSHLRAMLSSPNSPEHLGQQQMKRSMSFTSTNKKRASLAPFNNNNASTISATSKNTTPLSGPISVQSHNRNYLNNHNSPRSLNSPTSINYTKIHSPELSPSPEQQGYSKYRNQYTSLINNHIGISSPGIPTTVSSPSYNQMMASSRDSPSGRVVSPTTELYSGRYRNNFLSNSPNNLSHNNSLQYSRHSPLSLMQQASPQHCNNKTSVINSPTNFVNNLSKSKRSELSPTRRQLSPNSDYHSHHQSRENTSSRTIPKKAVAFRQPFNSPVSSPNTSSHGTSGETLYFNSANIEQQTERDEISDNRSNINDINITKSETEHRLASSPMDVKPSTDYIHNNNHAILSGFEIDPNNMIRPSMVQSLQQTPGMYLMYPPHNPAIVPSQSPYLSMYNYHQQMSYLAATYRHPLWMSYSSRMPALMYGGPGPINPLQHNEQYPQTTLPTTTAPNWSGNDTGDSNRRNKSVNNLQQLNSDDSIPLLRSRDEPSSDVPLNLSKH